MRGGQGRSEAGGATAEAVRSIRCHLLLAFLFGGMVNLLFLASPLYMMQLYGRVLNSRSVETLVSISIALALAVLMMGVADAARGRLLARAAARLASRLHGPVARRALDDGDGRVASRMADVESLRQFVGGGAVATLMDTPFTLLFLFVLFLVHPMLGLVASIGAAAILAVVGLARFVEARGEGRLAERMRGAAGVGAALGGDRGEIRALGLAHGLAARFAAEHQAICRLRVTSGEMAASAGAAARALRLAAHSAALATGALLAIEGLLAPSAMLAAAILAGRALGPIEALPGALRSVRLARDAAARLAGAGLSGPGRVPGRIVAGTRVPVPAGIEARRLFVVPEGAAGATLRSLSFTVAPGEIVSIAGPSGAGKSTLLRCLAGAEPIRAGEARVAGYDVGQGIGQPGGAGPIIGWLPREAPLYPGTIRANIARFGEASDAEVRAAAERAGAAEAISRLPRGFDTRIDTAIDSAIDSGAMSPALRQAIAFARALLPRPDLLLLDQPTAHLDAAGEVAVLNAVRALGAEGVTILVVSHKPVIAALADRIMLMRDGAIEVFEDRETVLDAMRRRALRPVSSATESAAGSATESAGVAS